MTRSVVLKLFSLRIFYTLKNYQRTPENSFFFFLMLFLSAYILFLCMYVCMYGCVGSSFLCEGLLQLRQAGATLHRGARASHHHGLSLLSTGSRRAGSAIVAHGPSCSAACGIFPDQGSNPRPLHWQADSQPLCHQGSPPENSYVGFSGVYLPMFTHNRN